MKTREIWNGAKKNLLLSVEPLKTSIHSRRHLTSCKILNYRTRKSCWCFYELHIVWFACWKINGFAFTTLHDWPKQNSRHFFIQSEIKPKPMVTHPHSFSRASHQLHVIILSFDWFTILCVSSVIGAPPYGQPVQKLNAARSYGQLVTALTGFHCTLILVLQLCIKKGLIVITTFKCNVFSVS